MEVVLHPVDFVGQAGPKIGHHDVYGPWNVFGNTRSFYMSTRVDPEDANVMLWFRFEKPQRIAKVGCVVLNNGGPKAFDVVASNDCNSWQDLLGVENASITESRSEN